ncbi:hypothetical protein L208DRAFT_1378179 [Tricholoma matsutake]|nr:hypothetical protein L208DRAFT_1378179 [Tricholoma matsutake 945]
MHQGWEPHKASSSIWNEKPPLEYDSIRLQVHLRSYPVGSLRSARIQFQAFGNKGCQHETPHTAVLHSSPTTSDDLDNHANVNANCADSADITRQCNANGAQCQYKQQCCQQPHQQHCANITSMDNTNDKANGCSINNNTAGAIRNATPISLGNDNGANHKAETSPGCEMLPHLSTPLSILELSSKILVPPLTIPVLHLLISTWSGGKL